MDYKNIFYKESKFSTIFNILLQAVGYAVVISVLYMYLMGYNFLIVEGYSAMPRIPKYSLIVTYKCPFEDIEVGDYITWYLSGTRVTHRIVNIDENTQMITTRQASFNGEPATDDNPHHYDQMEGRVNLVLVVTGHLISYVKGGMGVTLQTWMQTGGIIRLIGTIAMFVSIYLLAQLVLGKKQPYIPFSNIDMKTLNHKPLYEY